MKKIGASEIRNLVEYEKVREDAQRSVIALKKRRRVFVGPNLTFLFENRETVLFQIHEMVRTERIVEDAKLQDEVKRLDSRSRRALSHALHPVPGFLGSRTR